MFDIFAFLKRNLSNLTRAISISFLIKVEKTCKTFVKWYKMLASIISCFFMFNVLSSWLNDCINEYLTMKFFTSLSYSITSMIVFRIAKMFFFWFFEIVFSIEFIIVKTKRMKSKTTINIYDCVIQIDRDLWFIDKKLYNNIMIVEI